jgi:hypothetical protein
MGSRLFLSFGHSSRWPAMAGPKPITMGNGKSGQTRAALMEGASIWRLTPDQARCGLPRLRACREEEEACMPSWYKRGVRCAACSIIRATVKCWIRGPFLTPPHILHQSWTESGLPSANDKNKPETPGEKTDPAHPGLLGHATRPVTTEKGSLPSERSCG